MNYRKSKKKFIKTKLHSFTVEWYYNCYITVEKTKMGHKTFISKYPPTMPYDRQFIEKLLNGNGSFYDKFILAEFYSRKYKENMYWEQIVKFNCN